MIQDSDEEEVDAEEEDEEEDDFLDGFGIKSSEVVEDGAKSSRSSSLTR
jgi:hypothetical protein